MGGGAALFGSRCSIIYPSLNSISAPAATVPSPRVPLLTIYLSACHQPTGGARSFTPPPGKEGDTPRPGPSSEQTHAVSFFFGRLQLFKGFNTQIETWKMAQKSSSRDGAGRQGDGSLSPHLP